MRVATIRSRKPGREALDLGDDRLGRVAGVAVGHVGVGPDRVDVAGRAARVGQVLLADEHERPLRHPPAVDVALGGDDLLEGAGRRARSRRAGALVRPRDAALDREVDLERAGPVAVAAVAPRRPGPAAGRRRCRRPRAGARSSTTASAAGSSASERTGRPVSIVPPCSRDDRRERVGDRLRAAAGHRPAVAVAGADQRQPDRGAERAGVSGLNACAATPPKSARACGVAQRARQHASPAAPPRSPKRASRSGCRGTCSSGCEDVLAERVEACRRRRRTARRQAAPAGAEPRRGRPRASAASAPALPSSSGWARSTSGQAHSSPWRSRPSGSSAGEPTTIGWIAEQSSWTRPGSVSSAAAGAAADRLGGLEHRHLDPGARQRRGAGEAVRPGADDDRAQQRSPGGPGDHLDRERAPVEPGLLHDHVGDADVALLDQPGGGVEDPVVLAPVVGRLRLERDDPQLARREAAPLLDRRQQPLVVEVAVAEVPAEDDAGDRARPRGRRSPRRRRRRAARARSGRGRGSASSGTPAPCRGGRRSGPRRRTSPAASLTIGAALTIPLVELRLRSVSLRNSHWLVAQLPA